MRILRLLPLAALLLCSCTPNNGANGPAGNIQRVIVQTLRPVQRDAMYGAAAAGVVRASQVVNVTAPVDGQLISVVSFSGGQAKPFVEGGRVAKGEILFAIARNVAGVEALHVAEAKLDKQLQALAAIKARNQEPTQLQTDAVAKSRKAVADIVKGLNCVPVRAPIDGIIGQRLAAAGTRAKPGDDPLAVIVAGGPAAIEMKLQGRALNAILTEYQDSPDEIVGREILVNGVGQSDAYRAKIRFVDNQIDAEAKSLKVVADFLAANPLRDGQPVEIEIPLIYSNDALLVDERAIQANADGPFIWVVSDEGVVGRRPVEVGPLNGKLRIVVLPAKSTELPRLKRSDDYIVSTTGMLAPGQTVSARAYDPEELANE